MLYDTLKRKGYIAFLACKLSEKLKCQMSENSYFFYLPPGILKVEQIQRILFNPVQDFHFTGGSVEVNGEINKLNEPTIAKDLWHWNVYEYPVLSTTNSSKLSIEIQGLQKFDFDLDQLTLVAQTEEKIDRVALKNAIIFEFKSGYFVPKESFSKKIAIDKVNVLHYQKRMAYETACEQNHINTQRFDELCHEGFDNFFEQFMQFDQKRSENRIQAYQEKMKSQQDFPVSPFLNPDAPYPEDKTKAMPKQNEYPFILTECPANTQTSLPEQNLSPTTEEVKQFLIDMEPLFPADDDKLTFCGIRIDDPDMQAQRMFCFNLGHFLVLFGAFTGVTFDYRITMCEGMWKLEDRFTGAEVKKDTMNKSNPLDNPYRNALISCLNKLADELQVSKTGSIVKIIHNLEQYYKSL